MKVHGNHLRIFAMLPKKYESFFCKFPSKKEEIIPKKRDAFDDEDEDEGEDEDESDEDDDDSNEVEVKNEVEDKVEDMCLW